MTKKLFYYSLFILIIICFGLGGNSICQNNNTNEIQKAEMKKEIEYDAKEMEEFLIMHGNGNNSTFQKPNQLI